MQTNRFTSLREISQVVNEKIEKLHSGEMSISEIEALTDSARELYERLITLKFKAYEDEVKVNNKEEAHEVAEPASTPEINFKIEDEIKPEFPAQVNLIDVIEEVTRAEEFTEPVVADDLVSTDTNEIVSAGESTPLFAPELTENKTEQVVNSLKESLHDKLARSIGNTESLAQKMEHYPISDLKRAITLNQRFQFSKELFKGNNQDYEVAIDRLNNSSREDAMRQIEALRNKYQWSNESAVTSDFLDLVERRYL